MFTCRKSFNFFFVFLKAASSSFQHKLLPTKNTSQSNDNHMVESHLSGFRGEVNTILGKRKQNSEVLPCLNVEMNLSGPVVDELLKYFHLKKTQSECSLQNITLEVSLHYMYFSI